MQRKIALILLVTAILVGLLFVGSFAFIIFQYVKRSGSFVTPPGYTPEKTGFPTLVEDKGAGLVETTSHEAGVTDTISQTEIYRKIIYEAYLSLEVENVEAKIKEAESVALKYGGYVGNMQLSKNYGRVVLRIPTEHFYEALNDLRTLGNLKSENIKAIDVTEEYIDLVARLNNSKAVEARLLALLEKAKTVEDVLKVEGQLRIVREEIERLTAKLRYLENRIEYSTITVEFTGPKEKPEIEWPTFEFLQAVADGLSAMYGMIYLMIILLFALMPLIIIGAIAYAIYKLYKKYRSK